MVRPYLDIRLATSPVWEGANVPCGERERPVANVHVSSLARSQRQVVIPLACFDGVSFCLAQTQSWCYRMRCPSLALRSLQVACQVGGKVHGVLCRPRPKPRPCVIMIPGTQRAE